MATSGAHVMHNTVVKNTFVEFADDQESHSLHHRRVMKTCPESVEPLVENTSETGHYEGRGMGMSEVDLAAAEATASRLADAANEAAALVAQLRANAAIHCGKGKGLPTLMGSPKHPGVKQPEDVPDIPANPVKVKNTFIDMPEVTTPTASRGTKTCPLNMASDLNDDSDEAPAPAPTPERSRCIGFGRGTSSGVKFAPVLGAKGSSEDDEPERAGRAARRRNFDTQDLRDELMADVTPGFGSHADSTPSSMGASLPSCRSATSTLDSGASRHEQPQEWTHSPGKRSDRFRQKRRNQFASDVEASERQPAAATAVPLMQQGHPMSRLQQQPVNDAAARAVSSSMSMHQPPMAMPMCPPGVMPGMQWPYPGMVQMPQGNGMMHMMPYHGTAPMPAGNGMMPWMAAMQASMQPPSQPTTPTGHQVPVNFGVNVHHPHLTLEQELAASATRTQAPCHPQFAPAQRPTSDFLSYIQRGGAAGGAVLDVGRPAAQEDPEARPAHKRPLRLWAHIYLHMQTPGFDLVPMLIGRGGQNMRKIADATNAKVRVRGRGSGHLEIEGKREAPTPLMVAVTTEKKDMAGFRQSIDMTLAELRIVEHRFRNHCLKQQIPVEGPAFSIGLLTEGAEELLRGVIDGVHMGPTPFAEAPVGGQQVQ